MVANQTKRECDTCKWLDSQKDSLQYQEDQSNLEDKYKEIAAVMLDHRQIFHVGENK
jgi:hypothetical protein